MPSSRVCVLFNRKSIQSEKSVSGGISKDSVKFVRAVLIKSITLEVLIDRVDQLCVVRENFVL